LFYKTILIIYIPPKKVFKHQKAKKFSNGFFVRSAQENKSQCEQQKLVVTVVEDKNEYDKQQKKVVKLEITQYFAVLNNTVAAAVIFCISELSGAVQSSPPWGGGAGGCSVTFSVGAAVF
jgi:hypothetical protein